MINDKSSFELYGYDLMIDKRLKPYLIEVTSHSSALFLANVGDPYKCDIVGQCFALDIC